MNAASYSMDLPLLLPHLLQGAAPDHPHSGTGSVIGKCASVVQWIMLFAPDAALCVGDRQPLDYEALLARHDGCHTWPSLDELSAAFLCYTPGPTDNPKGVAYSHRVTVLHAYACALPDSRNVSAREVIHIGGSHVPC
ncbi:hypothetical protein [Cupriavidus sp. AcVe19-1a]|uniref:hypothetical protein n=1 Tax=Cupriavidus sp. AcVe19-1a TaxID=2821359 RepID=UPI001AE0EB46|nr:hypothetical protein [Cupriavidus sp. AcVe19-1a]MBP0630541.1 hypothetical protein [Cupriavidus sp. AcVe19-1a]